MLERLFTTSEGSREARKPSSRLKAVVRMLAMDNGTDSRDDLPTPDEDYNDKGGQAVIVTFRLVLARSIYDFLIVE